MLLGHFQVFLEDLQIGNLALEVLAYFVDGVVEGRVFGDLVVVHLELLGGQEDFALASCGMLA